VGLKSGFSAYTMNEHQRYLRKSAKGGALAGGAEGARFEELYELW